MPIRVLQMGPVQFIPADEKKRAETEVGYSPASFSIVPLSLDDREEVQNLFAREGTFGSAVLRAVRGGLRGWSGILGADGQPAPFQIGEDGKPLKATVELLPWDVVYQLAKEIKDRSFLSQEARGNSVKPST